jgi:hypothetical protein
MVFPGNPGKPIRKSPKIPRADILWDVAWKGIWRCESDLGDYSIVARIRAVYLAKNETGVTIVMCAR